MQKFETFVRDFGTHQETIHLLDTSVSTFSLNEVTSGNF